jgi:hypothetical protein
MKASHGYLKGYTAQTVADEGQIVIAAEITITSADFSNLNPMITAAIGELERAGNHAAEIPLAYAGYRNEQHTRISTTGRPQRRARPCQALACAKPSPGSAWAEHRAGRRAVKGASSAPPA